MNIHARADVATRRSYTGFDRLPIGGEWRRGKTHLLQDHDPYTGEVILEIPQGDRNDLDDAYAFCDGRLVPRQIDAAVRL
jgi:hypothetical protein